jgi:hypothetical protein
LWTLLGTPCVNVPGLVDPSGLPLGVQIVARFGRDRFALSAAAAFLERSARRCQRLLCSPPRRQAADQTCLATYYLVLLLAYSRLPRYPPGSCAPVQDILYARSKIIVLVIFIENIRMFGNALPDHRTNSACVFAQRNTFAASGPEPSLCFRLSFTSTEEGDVTWTLP